MGLLGKSFTSKFKSITALAISRIAILTNHRKARASYAHSDVVQLLNLGYHNRALLRVEQWIAEQNMLDVFVMIEIYCNFLRERAQLLENNKECPIELKEATCSIIFASSRCGEFPELHKIQEIFTSKFGKQFADHAVGLHQNNSVNSKMVHKLSSRRPPMEIKMKALEKIAAEIGVTLYFEQDPTMDKVNVDQRQVEHEIKECSSSVNDAKDEKNTETENIIQEKMKNKYAAAAALEALELAYFEIKKYSNSKVKSSSKSKDEVVISKGNNNIIDTVKQELEGKEIQKQSAWEEKSEFSQKPKDDVDLANDYDKIHRDVITKNEELREEKECPSSQVAIRWNPERSQNVRKPVMESSTAQKGIHTQHDRKMMSVRTR